ncbi:3-isopropylmalate/(R)-2-methylmalate dehydratase small subunit [Pseudomonas cuatrocienegasensis]|uniref:3-isopropylmalate dehydratase n=1 Tax=Pseudomonas cuatrocienegasensis TaxID=543360 RepID=A0ABY1BMH0_9PSED|nr:MULTISPECIES: 3-isopropylmalate dehydratase small subunit [Pseudomonas]OEC34412.1 3-isopropylmalate dehydratase small subunit [Pseudomonas sp. 21C1]SER18856.1 3-isopropylmalate/(R)-2-methylmalate dehydratase small subunit [Pseudomonas cuatrocienegasensis]
MAKPFVRLSSGLVVLDQDNIDTDQIVPARFMTTLSSAGLAQALFADARNINLGQHPLDTAWPEQQRILLGGHNFGCGSSREHAVWAIRDFGFEAVLAPRIADIFRSNALNNGLLALEISTGLYARLVSQRDARLTLDLQAQTLSDDSGAVETFAIDPFARYCLLRGIDRLDYLLQKNQQVNAYEEGR